MPAHGVPFPFIVGTLRVVAVSKFVYTFSDVREIVRDHEETFNQGLSDREKKKKEIVAFDTPALVDTRNSASKPFLSTKMNNPVTAVAIKEFLDRNKKYFKQGFTEDPSFVPGTNKDPIWFVDELTKLGSAFDADIVEFDDEFSTKKFKMSFKNIQLVYSVVVNR